MHDNNENNDEDEALWAYVTRDIEPLDKDRVVIEKSDKRPSKQPKNTTEQPSFQPSVSKKKQPLSKDLDRRTELRLERGQFEIDAVIDLHGMNQRQAKYELETELASSYKSEKRMVLVITGKGARSETGVGVLKENVPLWLNENPLNQIVLQFRQAKPKDGGDGALYVLLRRKR